MTFYDGKEQNDEIIKDYSISKYDIKVNYLFSERTIPFKREDEEKIVKIMIEQALERDRELYDKIYKETKEGFIQTLLSLIPFIMSVKGEIQLTLCLSFILGLIASYNFTESYEKLKEMKKFRLYYSLKEELDKRENQDITKIIEFEPYFREPINMGTLDKFSYHDVKLIKKELKKRNNISGQFQRV